MTPSTPWNAPVAAAASASARAGRLGSRTLTLQEIMDEQLAKQLYEEELRAIETLTVNNSDFSDLFSDLEEKASDRELLGADSFDTVVTDDESVSQSLMSQAVSKPPAHSVKSKPRFDRSVPIEGTAKGLNSIRESFRRWDKTERHGHGGGRVEVAKFATHDAVLDERTTLLLQKMINRGDIDEVYGCMQSGKEANVYFAVGTDPKTYRKREYAIKIFKTTLNAFANRKDYITGDRRFDLAFQKKDRRRQIHEWSEKEFRNLSRACRTIRAPEPLLVKDHIVVMQLIGNAADGLPAPTLKEVAASMTPSQLIHAYVDLLSATRTLCRNAKLVHGDLSEYNVLYHKQRCWLIDFGQAMDQTHPDFLEYLRRDLVNLRRFFAKHGLPEAIDALEMDDGLAGLLSVDEAFAWVTAATESEVIAVVAKYPKLQAMLRAKQ